MIVITCLVLSTGQITHTQEFIDVQTTTSIAWHPDGQYLAILQESQVDIIDASTIEVLNTITGLDAPLTRSVWSPDGQLFAFANSNHVAIWSTPWDLQQSHLVRELKIHDEDTSAGDVSWVDGRIAMSSDTDVIIFETENYSNILQIPQLNPIRDLQLSPDGELIAVSRNLDTLGIWNVQTGEIQHDIYFDPYLVQQNLIDPTPLGLDWSSSGEKVAFGATNGLRILDLTLVSSNIGVSADTDPSVIEVERNYTYNNAIFTVDWHPTQNFVASGDQNGTIKVWNVDTGGVVEEIQLGENVWVESVAWSPDGTRLAYGLPPDGSGVPVVIMPSPIQQPPTITDFTLINADADTDIAPLNDGDSLNIPSLPSNLALEATVTGSAASVVFDRNGTITIDNDAPFRLSLTLNTGTFTLAATPYSGADGTGDPGAPLTINFTVTDVDAPVECDGMIFNAVESGC